mmetsp:Transcript_45799/g.109270  ORF Transcript_45799/g.109270 Transcript_45799/m.109270 type:complete len:219 (-) Transcript_45799:646-1302(-)
MQEARHEKRHHEPEHAVELENLRDLVDEVGEVAGDDAEEDAHHARRQPPPYLVHEGVGQHLDEGRGERDQVQRERCRHRDDGEGEDGRGDDCGPPRALGAVDSAPRVVLPVERYDRRCPRPEIVCSGETQKGVEAEGVSEGCAEDAFRLPLVSHHPYDRRYPLVADLGEERGRHELAKRGHVGRRQHVRPGVGPEVFVDRDDACHEHCEHRGQADAAH